MEVRVMSKTTNVLIVGVGGQGTLLASKLLGNAMTKSGHDVKVSEIHGMSQRGGSVVTYVRFGPKVYSPVIERGSADIMVSFEKLEAARFLPYLKKSGYVIVNNQRIDPIPVITGKCEYPENILDKIKAKKVSVIEVNALKYAEKAGSTKSVNVVLMGCLAKILGNQKDVWIESIKDSVSKEFIELNINAFILGYNSLTI